jgi:hypothetical protein
MKTEPIQKYPIKGKFYKVISGPYIGFIGECVGINLNSDLPVILEDMDFRAKAVKLIEIEENFKQPSGKRIDTPNN